MCGRGSPYWSSFQGASGRCNRVKLRVGVGRTTEWAGFHYRNDGLSHCRGRAAPLVGKPALAGR